MDRQGKRIASKASAGAPAASELADARAQQAAVNEILRVMADSPADVMVVLDAIARQAAQLCRAPFARMTIIEGDILRPVAGYAVDNNPGAAGDVPLARTSIQGRAIVERRTLHYEDIAPLVEVEFPAAAQNARTMGFRAVLAVPLLRGDDALGALFLYRREPGLFSADQVALVETFARQAAIALHNVQQFRATQDALEQQTATAEILRVISRAHDDVQPVFDTIARSALTLCAAASSVVVVLEDGMLSIGGLASTTKAGADFLRTVFPRPPSRDNGATRAVLTREVVVIPDILEDAEYATTQMALMSGFRSVLAVPLMRDGAPIGSVSVGRDVAGAFPSSQIELLQTFAAQAVIALENVRLFTELEQRNAALSESLEQRTATSDILGVISRSPTDVQPVFETIAENALRLCEGIFSAVYRYDGDLIHLGALRNVSPEGDAAFHRAYPCKPNRNGTTQRAILTGEIVHTPDIRLDREYAYHDVARAAGFRSVLSVPMLRDGKPIGTITVFRAVAGAFPEAKMELLRTFADQAVIAVENVRLFTELEARNRDLSEALEHQTATSEILRVIARTPGDVQPVFDTIASSALKLCKAASALVTRRDGDLITLVASANLTDEGAAAMREAFPMPVGTKSTSARALRLGSMVAIPDVLADEDYEVQSQALRGGFRSTLAVPLMHDGRPIGTITVGNPEPGRYPDSQIALLKTFADQAVIAIENVRLFNELDARNRDLVEALEQQTATSDILRVMSQSQTDVQPVFDTIVRSVLALCDAAFSGVYLVDGDMIDVAATAGMTPDATADFRSGYPRRLGADTVSGRAAFECRVVQTADLMTDPDYTGAPGTFVGARTVLGVPLTRDGRAIGSIGVWRNEVKPFSETQISLLQTFADQAVIAIENVRLFTELQARNADLTEALEQQTATSEILRVISQSRTDVQPVFDTIARLVLSLCRARFANVFTYDGKLIHLAAFVNVHEHFVERMGRLYPRPPGRATAVARSIASNAVCMIADVLADPEYEDANAAATGGFRSVLAVPLLRDGKAVGGLTVGRPDPGDFPPTQIALLQTFADQAVIAIENVRLFNELQARTAQLTRSVSELRALGEVGQAVSSTLDVETVLGTIVTHVTKLTGMDGGSIYEYDEHREEFHLHSANGLPAEVVEALRAAPIRKGEGALGKLATTGEAVEIHDIADERVYQSRVRNALVRIGYRSMLVVPLLRESHLLGGLVVNRRAPGAFDPQVLELMKTFATQSAMAIQNARLYREIETKSRELETASRHKSEFLANMSHELRTPLNAIIGFSEVLSERLFGELNEKQSEYVGDIADSGRHLLALINDILDLSKIEAGRMELDASEIDLGRAVVQTLSLVRERAERRAIAMSSEIDPAIGEVRADARKVKQVLLNLLSNALKFTPEGGRIDVRAKAFPDRVEVSVSDTGVGIAPEDQEAVFEEFRQVGASAARAEGTGLGLAISRKFIELHGGRMWLHSVPGQGSTFTFSIPRKQA